MKTNDAMEQSEGYPLTQALENAGYDSATGKWKNGPKVSQHRTEPKEYSSDSPGALVTIETIEGRP